MTRFVSLAVTLLLLVSLQRVSFAQTLTGTGFSAKILLDNPNVRVVQATWSPGGVQDMSKRPARTTYYLTDAALRRTYADGRTELVSYKAGDVDYRPADEVAYSLTNLGSSEARLIAFFAK